MKNIKKKVVIIDYKLGNLFSVKQACDKVGINARISADRSMILGADALILPGVGAFSEAMKNLEELKLISASKIKLTKKLLYLVYVLDYNYYLLKVKSLVLVMV